VRILELVPHAPRADPRVGWVTQLCAELARTDLIAAVPAPEGPRIDYDGRVSIELVPIEEFASTRAKAVAAGLGGLLTLPPVAAYLARTESVLEREAKPDGVTTHFGAAGRLLAVAGSLALLSDALERRCRALSAAPDVVVCHDVQTLPAGLDVKRRFGARLLYDTHELWPEINVLAPSWERALMATRERRLVRGADAVVTVSPPLARHLERLYGIDHVVVAPNAEPFVLRNGRPAPPTELPLRVLYQGRAVPGRGLQIVLEGWREIDADVAVLAIRAPRGAYVESLRRRYASDIARGAVEILDPVEEGRLVVAAAEADIGLIPYPANRLLHRYACPNKLSQYMQAGLAILSERLDYVGAILDHYDCGITYDSRRPATVAAAVAELAGDLGRVDELRRNAYEAAREDFNWGVQSGGYREALAELLGAA
jgi:glycosyltransferase involved in cell wall biosynthesis